MNYLTRLSENLFVRKVNWLKKQQEGEAVSCRLDKPVLYEEDAYEFLCYWVNRTSTQKLYEGRYDRDSNLLKLVCDSSNIFYWMYCSEGMYYAVQIGPRSRIYIGRTSYIPYCELARGYNDVEVTLADRLPCFDGEMSLVGRFVYDENGMRPFLLVLKGYDIPNINRAPWNNEVDFYDLKALENKHYDVMGRRGEWYEVWYSDVTDEVYRCPKRPEDGGDWIHAKWWGGEKIVCQFLPTERPTVREMTDIWDNFRKVD